MKSRRFSFFAIFLTLSGASSSIVRAQDSTGEVASKHHVSTRIKTGSLDELKSISKVFVFTGTNADLYEAVAERVKTHGLQIVSDIYEADVILLLTQEGRSISSSPRLPPEYYDQGDQDSSKASWNGTVLRNHGRKLNSLVLQISETTAENASERLTYEFLAAYDNANRPR